MYEYELALQRMAKFQEEARQDRLARTVVRPKRPSRRRFLRRPVVLVRPARV